MVSNKHKYLELKLNNNLVKSGDKIRPVIYKNNFEVPKRDNHVFKIDSSNGILHQISSRVILEGSYFYISH